MMEMNMTDEELYNLVLNTFVDANKDYIAEQVKDACKHCSNNPNNGGSGVCNCILGGPVVY